MSNVSAYNLLNDEEKLILKKIYLLPLVLEKICETYKPHLLCNHLFELSTTVNSWYAKYSVTGEENPERQKAMLQLCQKAKNQLEESLELLGIEPVNKL